MNGLICYYSNTGNTKLGCEYIKKKSNNIDFELHNLINDNMIKWNEYDFFGLATYSDFGGIPKFFINYLNDNVKLENKPAFLFITYGFLPGNTLNHFKNITEKRGFDILTGFSLHTPENYSPNRTKFMKFDNYPKTKHMKKFDKFIKRVNQFVQKINCNKNFEKDEINPGLINSFIPVMKRDKSKEIMGKQYVNKKLCTECGICEEICAYNAINLNPTPVFDHEKCYGCWACYNNCPEKAIYTSKYKGKGQYKNPSRNMINKLK